MQSFEVLNQLKTLQLPDQTYSIILPSLIANENDVQTKFFNLERVKNTECPQIPRSEKNSCHLFKRYCKCPQSVPDNVISDLQMRGMLIL